MSGLRNTPKFILAVISLILVSGVLSLWHSAYAQNNNRKKPVRQTETFTRPKPTKPATPVIPGVNRFQSDKVFLENADSLYRPPHQFDEFQVVRGNVKFRHGSMWMLCDSAFYYPEKNSLEAFGHVEMRQGDTLFVYSDRLFYDGMSKHAVLTKGPSRSNVQMKDPRMTLTTDSLDYDVAAELGWYNVGGKLEDNVNTLTSVYGEYSPATKIAKFRDDVRLNNYRDGYRMFTEELEYNTRTHIADINQQTRIEGANDTILTTKGWYDTANDHAQLISRSTIIHSDSARNITTLEGDSIIYDKPSRISRAYSFRDPMKHPRPMVITDTARKVTLIGGYGEYNDAERSAMSTDYPLLIEYSRPDTLFLRADTVRSFIRIEKVWPDSLKHAYDTATRARLRSYRNIGEIAGSMPIRLLVLPEPFPLPGGKRSAGAKRDEFAVVDDETVAVNEGALPDSMPKPRLDKLGRDSLLMIPKEFKVAKAIGRARFFNKDIQGVADTLRFQEFDSTLYMIRKPIVWSGERQVYGNLIQVHFNDSTVESARLPRSGVVAEHIDEDFYNQLSGSNLYARFKNSNLEHLFVDGNVQAIFLPHEKDSTYNKLVQTESSYLEVDMDGREMKHLKMWPDVSGSVIPLFDIKKSQQFLEGFRWLEALRPKRSWYGDTLKWEDELGDIPDELDSYFKEPDIVRAVPRSPFENMKKTSSAGPASSLTM